MTIEGICKCGECQKEFPWSGLVAHKWNSNVEIHKISEDKVGIYRVLQKRAINDYNYPTEVIVRCRFCDYANRFKTEYYLEEN